MRVLVDTNVLLRIAQPASPQCDEAIAALDVLYTAGYDLCVVPQVIYEYWVFATRPLANNGLELSATEARAAIEALLPNYTLLPDDAGIYPIWFDLVTTHAVHGKPAHDARFVAAMLLHDVKDFLTFNALHFQRYNEVQLFTPADILAGKLPT